MKSALSLLGRRRAPAPAQGERAAGATSSTPSTSSTTGKSYRRKGSKSREPSGRIGRGVSDDGLNSQPVAGTSARESRSHSKTRGVAAVATEQLGENLFRVVVPQGTRPGETIRVQAPDGKLVEIELPANSRPGKTITVDVSGTSVDPVGGGGSASSSPSKVLPDLIKVVRSNLEATTASCSSLWERLKEEIELQKGLWVSSSMTPQSFNFKQQSQSQQIQAVDSTVFGDLSQTQVLVIASAESGDIKQLLAALVEARQFSTVSRTLEECCECLQEAEDAMVTWECLLRALQTESPDEIEVWTEQARALGFQVPASLGQTIAALRRKRETREQFEERLRFALEADDREVLEQVVAEAEAMGHRSPLVQQASQRLRNQAKSVNLPKIVTGEGTGPSPKARTRKAAASGNAGAPPIFPFDGGGESPYDLPRPPPSAGGSASAGVSSRTSAEYSTTPEDHKGDGRTVKELLEECRRHCLNTDGCTDREDLLRLLVNHRNRSSAPPPPRSTPPPSAAPPRRPAAAPHSCGYASYTSAAPPAAAAAGTRTVWDRRTAPAHFVTRRAKALYVLGMDPNGMPTPAELRAAYRKAAMESHPDRQQNHSRQPQAKELFQQVKDHFDYLSGAS